MIKLHAIRLMREGEVALWRNGAIVWTGTLGASVSDVAFDTVCMPVGDNRIMLMGAVAG
jgi:hypothetical protein